MDTRTAREARPDEVKIAITSTREPEVTKRLEDALRSKGYQVVSPEEATHFIGDEEIEAFIGAEVRATKEALFLAQQAAQDKARRNTNVPSSKRKLLWKEKRKQLGRAAFGGK